VAYNDGRMSLSPRRFSILIVSILLSAGCGGFGAAAPPAPPAAPAPPVARTPAPASPSSSLEEPVVNAPEWRRGDRWVYEWTRGAERGTRTVEVTDSTTVNGVAYYVVEVGPTTQQYYTRDLHFAAMVQASRVLGRMVPPQPWFMWPLRAGVQWDFRGVYEEQQGPRKEHDRFAVVGIEQVMVPGGTFRAFKVVRQSDRPDRDEYWYAPEVRWYVRWIGRRGDVDFEEVLRTYQAAPRGT
jgi:hypothetical protein